MPSGSLAGRCAARSASPAGHAACRHTTCASAGGEENAWCNDAFDLALANALAPAPPQDSDALGGVPSADDAATNLEGAVLVADEKAPPHALPPTSKQPHAGANNWVAVGQWWALVRLGDADAVAALEEQQNFKTPPSRRRRCCCPSTSTSRCRSETRPATRKTPTAAKAAGGLAEAEAVAAVGAGVEASRIRTRPRSTSRTFRRWRRAPRGRHLRPARAAVPITRAGAVAALG